VTITFDPAIDQQDDVLRAVQQAYDPHATSCRPGPAPGLVGTPAADGWTALSAYQYVTALTPAARQLLSTILTSAPCPTADAQETAGLTARRYAEAHVCLENALRGVPQPARLPFDVVDDCFVVESDVAVLMMRAVERVQDETGPTG